MKLPTLLLTLTLLLPEMLPASFASLAKASDLAKELRIAEQTIETLFIGEPLWLNTTETAGGDKFLALLDRDAQSDRAIILIHGTGQGPDTPFVIGPLRELLSEQGYTTLSIQMPVLSEGASYPDYLAEFAHSRARISAAIDYLNKNSIEKTVLLGHSMGSAMLMDWIIEHGSGQLEAVITLGLGASNAINNLPLPAKLNVPLLDLYGEQDYPAVLQGAAKRRAAIKTTHLSSAQVEIPSADHFFSDKEPAVSERLLTWLQGSIND